MWFQKRLNTAINVVNRSFETESFTRSKMLRHNAFHQFSQLNLKKPVSPHSIHSNLREKIEDLGCDTAFDLGPVIKDNWHMTVHNGESSNFEADYVTFEGRTVGSIVKQKPWPWWLFWVKVISWCLVPIIIGILFLNKINNWQTKNNRDEKGELFIFYSGTYQRPEKSEVSVKDWVISLDVMMSYRANETGIYLIKPIFEKLKNEAGNVISSSERNTNSNSEIAEGRGTKLSEPRLTAT